MAGHATGARLPCVRAAHVILPLRAALLAAAIGPEVVEALTNCRAGRIARCRGRRDDVTPNLGALHKVGVTRQEVLVIEYVREGQNRQGLAAQPRVTLAANLILLIEGQVSQPVNDEQLIAIGIELGALCLLLFGCFDVLAPRPVTAFAADRHFAPALHLPVLVGRRWVGRHKIETGGMAAHAFCFGKTRDGELVRLARDRQFRIIEPDPALLLEIADLPRAGGLAWARVRIQRPTDRRREKEIARPAIAADRTDVIGLLPLSADDQRHFISLAVLGRARISRVDNDEKKLAVAVFGSHIELYGNVLQFCQIGIMPLCHGANVLEGDDRVVEIALDRLNGWRREDFRMPGGSPLFDLLIVTSTAPAAFAPDIGGAFEVFLA